MKQALLIFSFFPLIGYSQPYQYLGKFDRNGIPAYDSMSIDKSDSMVIHEIYYALPEKRPVPREHPEYLAGSGITEIKITGPVTIWVTFITESADWKNTLGYYSYRIADKKVLTDKLKKTIIFPNLCREDGLKPGTKVKLGSFSAGTTIGWFLNAQGWNKKITSGIHTLYSNPAYNPEKDSTLRNHIVFLQHLSKTKFLLGFEDSLRDVDADEDYNDVLFFITVSDPDAIDTSGIRMMPGRKPVQKELIQPVLK